MVNRTAFVAVDVIAVIMAGPPPVTDRDVGYEVCVRQRIREIDCVVPYSISQNPRHI